MVWIQGCTIIFISRKCFKNIGVRLAQNTQSYKASALIFCLNENIEKNLNQNVKSTDSSQATKASVFDAGKLKKEMTIHIAMYAIGTDCLPWD